MSDLNEILFRREPEDRAGGTRSALPNPQFDKRERAVAAPVSTYTGMPRADQDMGTLITALRGFTSGVSDTLYGVAARKADEARSDLRAKAVSLMNEGADPEHVLSDPSLQGNSAWLMEGAHEAVGAAVGEQMAGRLRDLMAGFDPDTKQPLDDPRFSSIEDEAELAVELGAEMALTLPADLPPAAFASAQEVIRGRMAEIIDAHMKNRMVHRTQFVRDAYAGAAGLTAGKVATGEISQERATEDWEDQLVDMQAGGMSKEDAELLLVQGVITAMSLGARNGELQTSITVGATFEALRDAVSEANPAINDELPAEAEYNPAIMATIDKGNDQILRILGDAEESADVHTVSELEAAYLRADSSTQEGQRMRAEAVDMLYASVGADAGNDIIKDWDEAGSNMTARPEQIQWVDEQVNAGYVTNWRSLRRAYIAAGVPANKVRLLSRTVLNSQYEQIDDLSQRRDAIGWNSTRRHISALNDLKRDYFKSIGLSDQQSALLTAVTTSEDGQVDEGAVLQALQAGGGDSEKIMEAATAWTRANQVLRTELLNLVEKHPEAMHDLGLREQLGAQAFNAARSTLTHFLATNNAEAGAGGAPGEPIEAIRRSSVPSGTLASPQGDEFMEGEYWKLAPVEAAQQAATGRYSTETTARLQLWARGYQQPDLEEILRRGDLGALPWLMEIGLPEWADSRPRDTESDTPNQ